MSRDYATVSPAFWTGSTGRSLRKDPESQIVAMYLITSQHANMIGLYYCPIAYIVADTGLSEKGASKGLRRLSEALFCTYDPPSEWVWVREMARFQVGAKLSPKDNLVTHVRRELEKVPNIQIKNDFIEKYRAAFHLPSPFEPSPLQAPCKPLRSHEQEQEQEQEQETKETPLPPSGESSSSVLVIDPPQDGFARVKSVYPKRDGGQNWQQAQRAWMARRKEGHTEGELLAGVVAYAGYVARTGKTGTVYVKQAATFFGPDKHFLADWGPPASGDEFGSLTGRAVL